MQTFTKCASLGSNWSISFGNKTLLGLIIFLIPLFSTSQSSSIMDYAILGGDSNCVAPNDCGVSLGATNVILGGNVGSYTNVSTLWSFTLQGGIYARNETHIFTDAQVSGSIWSANARSSSNSTLTVGHRANLAGNLYINGDIIIQPGFVIGQVTHPAETQYDGPTPQGGEVLSQPVFAPLPKYPFVNSFPPTGSTSIYSDANITPGSYDSIALNGVNELVFSGVGDYVFSAIKNTGYKNVFTFDFQNAPTGNIRLLIHGDVDLGKFEVNIINGGDASRIYAETHGTGSSSSDGKTAWYQNSGWIGTNKYSEWKGTVWAPFGGITISKNTSQAFVTGALFSPKFVTLNNGVTFQHVPFAFCDSSFVINISTPDSVTCSQRNVVLLANTSATNATYNWHTANGNIVSGANTLSPTVNKGGLYTLTVSLSSGCSQSISVNVPESSCIIPYYPPPTAGKSPNPTGSELGTLIDNANYNDTAGNIFRLDNGGVYIEVIAIQGQYQTLLSLLQSPSYGLTNMIDNGPSSLTISGLFPIQNLQKLDSLPLLINYVRPLFPPVVNSGIALSQGDKALRAPFARLGYNVAGEGVKVGVLSNSYNTQPGNKANIDVLNEDLPGNGNTKNPTPVKVLQDFPYGVQSDEGRAMLQIIHDVAPKAELAFTTGFLSAGNMAKGILDLAADSCDIIVDDITFITEPFLTDGVISQTVNAVADSGVSYFSSAGNFGDKSYASAFNPAPTPNNILGDAHDFGGGDIFQSVTLEPGNYTIVLQWQDSVYSIGQTSTGTNNDLDIYLTDDLGNTLFGFNRNNLNNDPLEVMPFTVTQHTQSNILIVRESGSQNVFFKYIVFQGNMIINEYQSGTSTIVGHPNAEGAMAVGAVLYSNTPEFGNIPSVASFSSRGGTPVNGTARNKPEFCAPNGVNTTVNLGGPNIESDAFPNFFGTSAAAPHAAGVAALLKSAQAKFENHNSTPLEIKNLLSNTAIDMVASGFDNESGSGFIQADQAILSFANPTPEILQFTFIDSTQIPGTDTTHVTISGNYFTPTSIVLLRDDTVSSNFINSSEIAANIPPFNGNPPVRVYNNPISSSLLDGGFSDSLLLFSPTKKNVQIVVNNKTKKYSEAIPLLTFEVLVDSIPFDSAGYSLYDLGLDSIDVFTTATSTGNVGIYLIRAKMDSLDLNIPFELGLSELFNYEFVDGSLTINPMPLTITAKDTTVEYGYPLGDFHFEYSFDDSLVAPSELGLFSDSIEYNHQSNLTNAVAVVRRSAYGRAVVNADLRGLSYAASRRSVENSRAVAYGRAVVNSAIQYDTTYFVEIAAQSIFDYQTSPNNATLLTAPRQRGSTPSAYGRAVVNARAVAYGRAVVNGYPLVNAHPLVNGIPLINGLDTISDSGEVALVFDENDLDTLGTDSVFSFLPINLITGTDVGVHIIVPAPLLNTNYNITYELGNLTITPATLTFKVDSLTMTYGDSISFPHSTSGYQYSDADSNVIKNIPTYTLLDSSENSISTTQVDAGTYTIVPDSLMLVQPTNYVVHYVLGKLVVNKANLIVTAEDTSKIYGKPNPAFNLSYNGFEYNDGPGDLTLPIVSCQAVDSSSIGVYPIYLLGGSSVNYDIILIDGILTVNPAEIYVTARDTFAEAGSPAPPFNYDILGDHYSIDSILSAPSLALGSMYTGAAGVYDINPSGLVIERASNYLIYYTTGQLYVNPKGIGTQKILLSLQCVDQISNHSSGFDYVAHISYSNRNSTPIYIPKGKNNVILSGGLNSDDPTEIFHAGNGSKDIYFDGSGFAWFVFSNQNNSLSYSLVYANNNSQKCIVAKKSSSPIELAEEYATEPSIYPNPVKNHLVINTFNQFAGEEIFIYDLNGKRTNENYILTKTDLGNYKVDFSKVRPGMYMVIVQTKEQRFTYKVIKD
ncbi:MBG domain-containing protein [Owenweeksia hongkongensis]|uniref:MBG domain-containing protein n=1 Tax=Owenweeksia hongkongensis TaxID=253245 RepID=UPI003A8CD35B